jgi:hypothetical protein
MVTLWESNKACDSGWKIHHLLRCFSSLNVRGYQCYEDYLQRPQASLRGSLWREWDRGPVAGCGKWACTELDGIEPEWLQRSKGLDIERFGVTWRGPRWWGSCITGGFLCWEWIAVLSPACHCPLGSGKVKQGKVKEENSSAVCSQSNLRLLLEIFRRQICSIPKFIDVHCCL